MSSVSSISETGYSSEESESSEITMGELWLPPRWEKLNTESSSVESESEVTIGELCLSTTREELGPAVELGVGVAVAMARRAE